MFSRLRQWISGWFHPADSLDSYHPGERLIFRYFDGRSMVRADPMALHQKLIEVWTDLRIDLMHAQSQMVDSSLARKKANEKLRRVFDIPEFEKGENGSGLTETELMELLARFWAFCDSLKKKLSPTTISSPETSPATPPSSNVDLATPSISAGGSTVEGNSTERPLPSPSGFDTPSD